MSSADQYDVVVVGGGFAGLTAGRDLTYQHSVLLLEARDRLGGRCFSKQFPGTDVDVEMGGAFIDIERGPETGREVERYGIELHHPEAPESFPTILNGKRYPGPSPVPFEQIFDLERAAIHCVLAASRIRPGVPIDYQGLGDLDIPFSQFLAPLELPPETYDYVAAIAGLLSFRFPEEGSALQYLITLASFDLRVVALWGALATFIRTSTLAKRMAADIGEVRLGCPVVRIDQSGEGVVVTTAAGETIRASAVVAAVPMNIWNDIEFVPQLGEEKRATSAERHGAERSGKAWLRVRNAPKNPYLLAGPRSANGGLAIYTEHTFENGDQLMCLYGLASLEGDDYQLDFTDRASLAHTLEAMLPGSELVEFSSHDYNHDPFSKGDWVSWRPGRVSRSHSALGAAEGRIAFATADVAPKWIMMIEGAFESGHRAASQTHRLLTRERDAEMVTKH